MIDSFDSILFCLINFSSSVLFSIFASFIERFSFRLIDRSIDWLIFHFYDIFSVEYINAVYDVTVGYADSIVQSEFELFSNGSCPKNIHFHVSKIDVNSLPANDDELIGKWLTKRWKKKEEMLGQFYHSDDVKHRTFKIDPENDEIFTVSFYQFYNSI